MKLMLQIKNKTVQNQIDIEDGQYFVNIGVDSTSEQMRYFHVCVRFITELFKDAGQPEIKFGHVKQYLKDTYLQADNISMEGAFVSVVPSVADLNKREYSDFIESMAMWCAETFGVPLPDPEEFKRGNK